MKDDEYLSRVRMAKRSKSAIAVVSEWVNERRGKRTMARICRNFGWPLVALNNLKRGEGVPCMRRIIVLDGYLRCDGLLIEACRVIDDLRRGELKSAIEDFDREPTMEEIERVIAEQLPTMPIERTYEGDMGPKTPGIRFISTRGGRVVRKKR